MNKEIEKIYNKRKELHEQLLQLDIEDPILSFGLGALSMDILNTSEKCRIRVDRFGKF